VRMGLVWRKHAFVWGHRHGMLLGWPHWIQSLIVTATNYVTCRLFGHETYDFRNDPEIPNGRKVCTNCSKEWK
jgi:hypothetical protein